VLAQLRHDRTGDDRERQSGHLYSTVHHPGESKCDSSGDVGGQYNSFRDGDRYSDCRSRSVGFPGDGECHCDGKPAIHGDGGE